MRGQIIKKADGVWLVRVQGRETDGTRKDVSKQVRGTKKDAEKFLTNWLREMDRQTFVEPSRETLGRFLDHWLETAARPKLRPNTYEGYKEQLARYIREPLAAKQIGDLKPAHIQAVYAGMLARGLSARTVQYAHSILSAALKQAVKWDVIARNPCDLVELPRQQRTEMKAFSQTEAAAFLAAAKEDKHGVVLTFALFSGMRPNEYLGLKWSDVDWHKGTVTVQRALSWTRKAQGGGFTFGEPKTSKSRRTIPLPVSLMAALREHKRKQNEARLKLGSDWQDNNLVFATDTGGPLHYRNLAQRHLEPILKAAKLSGFRLYDLRHSCATLLLAVGENPKVVSERLGHSSIVMTLDVYSHVLPDMQQAATEKLERMFYAN